MKCGMVLHPILVRDLHGTTSCRFANAGCPGCGARSPRFADPDDQKETLIRKMAQYRDVCSVDGLDRIDYRKSHEAQRDPL